MSGSVLASAGWDVWGALAGCGVAVALLLGFALAADGLRRAIWATVAVGVAAGFAAAFPLLFPGVTPEAVLPFTVWPRLGYAAAVAAGAFWALVMLPGGAAQTTGGAWACRAVGVAAFGAGWWSANPAFADQLPEMIASALADSHVPFGCAVLAPLCLAAGAWFNPCRRAAGRWLTRAVAVVAVGGAAFAGLELFGTQLPPEVAQHVSWREIALGAGAGVGLCLLVAALMRKPTREEEAKPLPVAVESPYNVSPPVVAKPPAPQPKPDVPDAGSPFSRFIPKPVPQTPPKSRMEFARPPALPPAGALEPNPAPPPHET